MCSGTLKGKSKVGTKLQDGLWLLVEFFDAHYALLFAISQILQIACHAAKFQNLGLVSSECFVLNKSNASAMNKKKAPYVAQNAQAHTEYLLLVGCKIVEI